MNQVIIPENYHSVLSMYEDTGCNRDHQRNDAEETLYGTAFERVTAPLFVDPASGLNDDLNGGGTTGFF